MAQIIDGKATAQVIKDELKEEVALLKKRKIEPTLAVVIVGEDSASHVYVRNKKRACEYIGIRSISHELPKETTEEELLRIIYTLNKDNGIHGILVQLPLPKHIDEEKVIMAIDPLKDVDGFHPINVGNLSIGNKGFVSCTPAGIIELLKRYKIEIEGKHCVVVGRSNIVGKPISILLLRENATVTICHSKTKDLQSVCKSADILIAAVGKGQMINKEYVSKNTVVIDVGINRTKEGKLCGDVAYEEVYDVVSHITPVPGGVGPMTIAMLMGNVIESAKTLQ